MPIEYRFEFLREVDEGKQGPGSVNMLTNRGCRESKLSMANRKRLKRREGWRENMELGQQNKMPWECARQQHWNALKSSGENQKILVPDYQNN